MRGITKPDPETFSVEKDWKIWKRVQEQISIVIMHLNFRC